jgi:O-antigen ligase
MMLFKGFVRWKITHAHNMYLQVLLYMGAVGFGLLMGLLMTQLRMFLVAPSPVRDILVLYICLKGMTEQSILSNMPTGTVAVWTVTIGMAALAWNKKPAPKASSQPVLPLEQLQRHQHP